MNASASHPRYLQQTVADDLSRKMVFLGGLRHSARHVFAL